MGCAALQQQGQELVKEGCRWRCKRSCYYCDSRWTGEERRVARMPSNRSAASEVVGCCRKDRCTSPALPRETFGASLPC